MTTFNPGLVLVDWMEDGVLTALCWWAGVEN